MQQTSTPKIVLSIWYRQKDTKVEDSFCHQANFANVNLRFAPFAVQIVIPEKKHDNFCDFLSNDKRLQKRVAQNQYYGFMNMF